MLRVTTQTKIVMPSPNQTWSLTPGANHFESAVPDAVSERLAKLQIEGVIIVETLDGTGDVTPWLPTRVIVS